MRERAENQIQRHVGAQTPCCQGEAPNLVQRRHLQWGGLVPRCLLGDPHPDACNGAGKAPVPSTAPRLRQARTSAFQWGPHLARSLGKMQWRKPVLWVSGSLTAPSPQGGLPQPTSAEPPGPVPQLPPCAALLANQLEAACFPALSSPPRRGAGAKAYIRGLCSTPHSTRYKARGQAGASSPGASSS